VTSPDDFSPIAETGTIEPVGRFRGRRGDDGLPHVATGFEQVVCNAQGKPIKGASALTPGERRHAGAREWISVDKGSHQMRCSFPLRDLQTQAGLVATVTVSASVVDAWTVAERRIASVRAELEPVLHSAVTRAWRQKGDDERPANADRATQLILALRDAEALLDAQLASGRHEVDGWLSFTCTSVAVGFDDTTQRHYDELVRGIQDVEVADVAFKLEHGTTQHDIALRDLWRASLQEQLLDPSVRNFESVFANPTPEAIDRAVAQVTANESAIRSEVIPILETLVEKYYVDKDDRLLKVIVETVIHGLQGKPVPRDAEALMGRAPSSGLAGEPSPGAIAESTEDQTWGTDDAS
jgi:hypothetical protein